MDVTTLTIQHMKALHIETVNDPGACSQLDFNVHILKAIRQIWIGFPISTSYPIRIKLQA